jgi:hypothetical protein
VEFLALNMAEKIYFDIFSFFKRPLLLYFKAQVCDYESSSLCYRYPSNVNNKNCIVQKSVLLAPYTPYM